MAGTDDTDEGLPRVEHDSVGGPGPFLQLKIGHHMIEKGDRQVAISIGKRDQLWPPETGLEVRNHIIDRPGLFFLLSRSMCGFIFQSPVSRTSFPAAFLKLSLMH